MKPKIILTDTTLTKLGESTELAGAVAIAIARKQPDVPRPQPGEPQTSPCWLAWVVATDHPDKVDGIREQFAEFTGLPADEWKNVVAIKSESSATGVGQALAAFGGSLETFAFLGGGLFPDSCSIGGREVLVTTGAGSKPETVKASWGLAKGELLKGGDCACTEIKVWNRELTPDEVEEFNNEVTTHTGFGCD